jgi:hypothetical protein
MTTAVPTHRPAITPGQFARFIADWRSRRTAELTTIQNLRRAAEARARQGVTA